MPDESAYERTDERQEAMSSRLSGRFEERSASESTTETAETKETDKTTTSAESEDTNESAESLHGRTFMMEPATLQEIDIKYKQISAAYQLAYDEPLSKSEDFYPALFEAIDWNAVEAKLGIDTDEG